MIHNLDEEEIELLRASGNAEGVYKGTLSLLGGGHGFGPSVRVGKADFNDSDDPAYAERYIRALQNLIAKGLARHESGVHHVLTADGWDVVKELG